MFTHSFRTVSDEELKIPIFGREYKLVIKNEKGEVVKSEEKITREDLKSPYTFTSDADGIYTVAAGFFNVAFCLLKLRGIRISVIYSSREFLLRRKS